LVPGLDKIKEHPDRKPFKIFIENKEALSNITTGNTVGYWEN